MNVLLLNRRPATRLYDSVSEGSAAIVIRRYSSSFGLASLLLGAPVDNPDPSLRPEPRARMLAWLHDDVRHALATGYSANLVVHAFARTAIACGIGEELIDPFFASMAMDLEQTAHTPESFERYVYGSAEVVGLMCLRAFLAEDRAVEAKKNGDRSEDFDRLAPGARRLGAAFQKLNFLRDLAEDCDKLGRCYFPGLDIEQFCDADRDRILDDVDAIEAYNPRVAIGSFNEEAARFAAKYRIPAGAGSDAHVAQGLGSVRVRMRDFDGPTEFLESLRDADILTKPSSLLYVQALKFLQTKATPPAARRARRERRVRRATRKA